MEKKRVRSIYQASKENKNKKKREGTDQVSTRTKGDTKKLGRNYGEDALIEALDQKEVIIEHATWIEKLRSGKIDVGQFMQGLSPQMVMELLSIALHGQSEKSKLAAITDWLDRAGYGKVQKHALATVDVNQPKEALISMILGASKDLSKEGIEVVDDDQDQKE